MPIYEYVCQDCGIRFEALRSMSAADDSLACEGCHSDRTVRAISTVYAHSGGRVIAGGNSGCASCSAASCATCNQ
jgi:putative FmdB family regulatory protein